MRRAFRKDNNEGAIRKRAETLGFLWLENTASTRGRPDACLLRNGQTYWCEVKQQGEPFTKAQVEEFPRLIAKGVPVYVLEQPDDVVRLQQGTLPAWAPSDVTTTFSRGRGGRAKSPRKHRPGHSKARCFAEACVMASCRTSRLPDDYFCANHTEGA